MLGWLLDAICCIRLIGLQVGLVGLALDDLPFVGDRLIGTFGFLGWLLLEFFEAGDEGELNETTINSFISKKIVNFDLNISSFYLHSFHSENSFRFVHLTGFGTGSGTSHCF